MTGPVAEVELSIQDGTVDVAQLAGAGTGREAKELTLGPDGNDRFLDGPACRRVAVVDFDPATGLPLPPPARFVRSKRTGSMSGRFSFDGDPTSPATLAVNAFGIVHQTIRMFEGEDALGRQVTWAFGSEQLLVLPRAGEWANALYDRATHSLQFFWFPTKTGSTVYTALSRDIVAHECGHALLDAVLPSLYDSSTPESIAIHEAVADVVAVLMALDSDALRTSVLERTGNRLSGPNAFNGIAEEFGMARPGPGGLARRALRDLDNDSTLDDLTAQRPHVLSTLLSAIFYDTLRSIFEVRLGAELARSSDAKGPCPAQAANKALGTAHLILRRLLLRGIDYLPPGGLTFADVGRATLAADRASWADKAANPEVRQRRKDFAQRFVDRGIVPRASVLDGTRPRMLSVPPEQVAGLCDSDYLAFEYVNRNRAAFGIPAGVPFAVLPRVDAAKRIGPRDRPLQRELIVKVAWNHLETTRALRGAKKRLVPTGATASLSWDSGECLALVRSSVTQRRQRAARDDLLARLDGDGLLADDVSRGARGVGLRVSGGVADVSRTHRLLHLEGWNE